MKIVDILFKIQRLHERRLKKKFMLPPLNSWTSNLRKKGGKRNFYSQAAISLKNLQTPNGNLFCNISLFVDQSNTSVWSERKKKKGKTEGREDGRKERKKKSYFLKVYPLFKIYIYNAALILLSVSAPLKASRMMVKMHSQVIQQVLGCPSSA